MKALSIWQPWASLLMAGIKAYETRSWAPPASLLGERTAIHAAKTPVGFERLAPHLCPLIPGMAEAQSGEDLHAIMPLGCLLGTAILAFALSTDSDLAADILPCETALGDWSPGRWAWRFTDHQPLATPIPYRGQQGVFTIPDHLIP
jgi:hypothetical protein